MNLIRLDRGAARCDLERRSPRRGRLRTFDERILDIGPFSPKVGFHSLPSGHATVALTISLIMARQVKPLPLKILFYSIGTVTAASRLYVDAHWISDVAFGGAIAWFCADAAVRRIEANRFRSVIRKDQKVSWKLYPYPGGLSLRARL